MEISRWLRRTAAGAFTVALLAGGYAAYSTASAGAQSGGATVKVEVPQDPAKEGGDPVAVRVSVDNVTNLAGFTFILLYDDSIFSVDSYQKGDFLGSTGREVVCNEINEAGAFKLDCPTLRAPPPAGPNGGGLLATVMLKPKGSGNSELVLDHVKFVAADETATEIPVGTITNAQIKVEGSSSFNWLLWGPLIAVGALAVVGAIAFGAMRMSGRGKPATAL